MVKVRGRCPGVLDPMETGDGWLLRVRVPGGAITTASMRVVAQVASEYGSGAIDITSRANLQVRGVSTDAVDRAADALVDAGLAIADPAADAFRAVVASPLTGHDHTTAVDAEPLVAEIVGRLAADATRPAGAPPSKFGIVIDDGGAWPLDHLDADVRLRRVDAAEPEMPSWAVVARGCSTPIGTTRRPVDVAVRIARLCAAHGARLDVVIDGLGLTALGEMLEVEAWCPVAGWDRAVSDLRLPGMVEHPDRGRVNVIAAPFLGRLDALALRSVADVVERHAAPSSNRSAVRLTTAHSIAVVGVSVDGAAELLEAFGHLGFVIDGTDRRAAVSACVGAAGCASAHIDTTTAALEVIGRTDRLDRVHLSACSKGCGAPAGVRHLVADENGMLR